jgi:hypothetical protein
VLADHDWPVVTALGSSWLWVVWVLVVAEVVLAALVVPIDPVQAITPHAITKAASAPATTRRRIALIRRARSASTRRASLRLSGEEAMP